MAGTSNGNGANAGLFQVLALLLERSGEVVTRQELQQRLWSGDVFVDFDHGLAFVDEATHTAAVLRARTEDRYAPQEWHPHPPPPAAPPRK
jgi:DNA-binding winged helix-turn-helix (wHTH) protein